MPFENYLPQLGQGALEALPAFGDFSWRNRIAGNPQGFDESVARSVGGALSFLGMMGLSGGLGVGPLASMGAIGALQEGSARERAVRAATMPLTAMLAGPIAGRLGALIPEAESAAGSLQSTLLRGARTAAVELPGAAFGATVQPAVSHLALNALGEQQAPLTRDDALRAFGEQYITGLLTHGLQTSHGEDLRTAGLKQLANLHNTILPRDPSLLYAAAGGGAGIPREAFATRRSLVPPPPTSPEPPIERTLSRVTNEIPKTNEEFDRARKLLIAAHQLRAKIKGKPEQPKVPPFLSSGRSPATIARNNAALAELIQSHGGLHNLAVAIGRGWWPKTPATYAATSPADFDAQLMSYPEGAPGQKAKYARTLPELKEVTGEHNLEPTVYPKRPEPPIEAVQATPASTYYDPADVPPNYGPPRPNWVMAPQLGHKESQWVPPAPEPAPFSKHAPGSAAWWAEQTRTDPPSVSRRLSSIGEPEQSGKWSTPQQFETTETPVPASAVNYNDAAERAMEIISGAKSPAEGRRLLLQAQAAGLIKVKDIAAALGGRQLGKVKYGNKLGESYESDARDESGALINKFEKPVGINIEEGNTERYHETPLTPIDLNDETVKFLTALHSAKTVTDASGNRVKQLNYNGETRYLTLQEHSDLVQAYKPADSIANLNLPDFTPKNSIKLTEPIVTTIGHLFDTKTIEGIPSAIEERSIDTNPSRRTFQEDPSLEREDRWTPLGPAYATYQEMRSLNKPGEWKKGNYTFDEKLTHEASLLWGPDPFWRSAPVYAVDDNYETIDGMRTFVGSTERYDRYAPKEGDKTIPEMKTARIGNVPIGAELPLDPSDPSGKRKLPISKVREEGTWVRKQDLYGGTHVVDMEFANRPALDKDGNPKKNEDGTTIRPVRDSIYKALAAGKLINLDHILSPEKMNQFRDYILDKVDAPLDAFYQKDKKEFYKRANSAYSELIRNNTDPHTAISIIKELRDTGNAVGFLDNMFSYNLPARTIIDAVNALSPNNNFGSKALTSIKVKVRNDAGVESTEYVIGGYGQNNDYAAPQQMSLTKQRLNKWYELDPSAERVKGTALRHRVTDMPPSGRKYVRVVDDQFRAVLSPTPAPAPAPAEPATQQPVAQKPATEPKQTPINIYYGSGENKILSNLSPRPFTLEMRDGTKVPFKSVEHAYQSFKSGEFDQATYDKYYASPGRAKISGDKGTKTENNYSYKLMEKLIRESISQNPEVAAALVKTGQAKLTHTQDRGYWRTAFPEIMMKIRSELQQKQ